jgi:hypothetical protein
MAICMFKYLFDIKFSVSEDNGFFVDYKGKRSFIRVKTIKGANISSFTGEDFSWLLNTNEEIKENKSVLKITVQNKLEEVPVRYIHYLKNKDYFSGGMIQPTSFSIVEVLFEISNIKYVENKENIKILEKSASEIINNFTNKYRIVSEETDVYTPQVSTSPVIEIWISDKGRLEEFLTVSMKPYTQTVNFLGIRSPNKTELNKEKMQMLTNLLKDPDELPLYLQLLLDAKEQGHIKNNYELSVLKIGTAFEVFLQDLLVKACQLLDIQKLPVGRGKDLPTKDFKEAIQEGKIIEDLLKKYLKLIIGSNKILEGKEYNHWHTKAYTLRNEIIHSGRTEVSEKEARLAFESTNAIISLISTKVNQILMKNKPLNNV